MILIIGAGVAGLSCALAAVDAGAEVELVTPGRITGGTDHEASLGGGNTVLAQGGIAAALAPGDAPSEHLADTIAAGNGIVDAEAAAQLTRDGAAAVLGLIADGFPVDRDARGNVAFGLEGAHGRNRIVHAGGDRSGAALHAFLGERALAAVGAGRLKLTESRVADSLLVEHGEVVGALLRPVADDSLGLLQLPERRRADAVVLATGGYAALYPRTSNHSGARGEGVVIAASAGALVADLEFVQFHPTVLMEGIGACAAQGETDVSPVLGLPSSVRTSVLSASERQEERTMHATADAGQAHGLPSGTAHLISEAVRGAGAVLRDATGKRFMVDRHPLAELAPRDVVSREIDRVLRESGERAVWLDATGIERAGGRGSLAHEFPGIAAQVAASGFDWTREPIPVAPAAHYTMGGVVSDLDGRSTVPGLFVVGEVASTGVHGANRLASNSLLEGLVFGSRAGRAAAERSGRRGMRDWVLRGSAVPRLDSESQIAVVLDRAGVTPTGDSRETPPLAAAVAPLDGLTGPLVEMIRAAAEHRTESRGSHQRADFPDTDPAQAHRNAFRVKVLDRQTVHAEIHPEQRSLTSC